MKTILPLLGSKVKTGCYLPQIFLRISLCFASSNISGKWGIKLTSLSSERNSRSSFAKAWVSPRLLLILFGALFWRTPHISWKKLWTGQFILSIYRPSSANSIPTQWSQNQSWSAYFATAYGPLSVPSVAKWPLEKHLGASHYRGGPRHFQLFVLGPRNRFLLSLELPILLQGR